MELCQVLGIPDRVLEGGSPGGSAGYGVPIGTLPRQIPQEPLTIGRLSTSALEPLVDSIADRLPLWKAFMMTEVWWPCPCQVGAYGDPASSDHCARTK